MIAAALGLILLSTGVETGSSPQEQWTTESPRDEIRPEFSIESKSALGGPLLQIVAGDRPTIDGAWVKRFPVRGGSYYHFAALRKTTDVVTPRRSAVAKITWQDDDGNLVRENDDLARPEYPRDESTSDSGWTRVTATYRVPNKATYAKIELHLRWTQGSVAWHEIQFAETTPITPRMARLATVHFRPKGGETNQDKCELFAPLIAEAARQKADLVCLPESLTYYGSGKPLPACAEPIPGPSTEYFGQLARKHDLYIVAGLTEQAASIVYNTAVLLGPDGSLVGRYRKVCLPREEIEAGVTPGEEYPVFETRFGKVGMMVCWDVHFPEVARNLSNRGADVIAMPIWGGPVLGPRARAIENQIYLVSSTYTESERDAMVSGVWDREGNLLVTSDAQWGRVLVAEVDLNKATHWKWLGDLKARIPRERPDGGFQD